MNAVEIEEAVSALVEAPFDREDFPYAFLAAFGNKETTIKRLRSGATNKSDVPGGLLQRNNIHIAVCDTGTVSATLPVLRNSSATTSQKAKYILATDGKTIEAECLEDGETLACDYEKLAYHFGFFLPLAGITTVKQIRENAFDIKATSRLNKLYVELLKHNPGWEERREDLNHFFARLIFCFFAEDTGIFNEDLFTATIGNMSEPNSSNTHEVIAEIFHAMNIEKDVAPNDPDHLRESAGIRRWAWPFPYVNGGLFSGSLDVPRFTKMARSYLLHIGGLDWKQINPDIFGSMIQAVAEDEERGELGMHYTSVPNILKVLNPLFLDELREALEAAGDGSDQGSKRKLLNLRNRMARIRVFDPACGSGNFLVIAYKEMRAIEAEINRRRGEIERRSELPLTNFRGIEIRHFAAEIARLALIIAEYQCDVLYRGPKLALAEFLPLEAANWIVYGNALHTDWMQACPPSGTGAMVAANDLFETPLDQTEIDFANEGGFTYICGNPPYRGRNRKGAQEKRDTAVTFEKYEGSFASLDYVANWIMKAAEYCSSSQASAGLVATNSVCQGEQVALLWPIVYNLGISVFFAHTSFKWSNLACNNAGVSVIVLGLTRPPHRKPVLYTEDDTRHVDVIGPYLVPNSSVIVSKRERPLSRIGTMYLGNMAKDGGNLIITPDQGRDLVEHKGVDSKYVRKFYGSEELIKSQPRACIWIEDNEAGMAASNPALQDILESVASFRSNSKAASTRKYAATPHRFVQLSAANGERVTIVPRVSSEARQYLPVDYFEAGPIIGDKCYALYDEPLWNLAIIASRMHLVWIGTVCSRLELRYSYGNKLGWNTFPLPMLTDANRADLRDCAEDILLTRQAAWPATIADMYDPDRMDSEFPELRAAHERNDEVLERIYIGRRFKNDTERLEKLFAMYTEMIEREKAGKTSKQTSRRRANA